MPRRRKIIKGRTVDPLWEGELRQRRRKEVGKKYNIREKNRTEAVNCNSRRSASHWAEQNWWVDGSCGWHGTMVLDKKNDCLEIEL